MKELYKPFPSKAKNKRLAVYVMKKGKKTLINYGDSRYELNPDDITKERYNKRSRKIRDAQGNLTYLNRDSANYWSRKNWDL